MKAVEAGTSCQRVFACEDLNPTMPTRSSKNYLRKSSPTSARSRVDRENLDHAEVGVSSNGLPLRTTGNAAEATRGSPSAVASGDQHRSALPALKAELWGGTPQEVVSVGARVGV